jgi:hypothetical protein
MSFGRGDSTYCRDIGEVLAGVVGVPYASF